MTPRTTRVVYWISSLLFAAPQVWSAYLMLSRTPWLVDKLSGELGYPGYFLTVLGVSKLLGVATVLTIWGGSRLKEWAYAGLTFEVLGGFLSQLAVNDAWLAVSVPLLQLCVQTISYATWKRLSPVPEPKPSISPSGRPATLGRWPYSERESLRIRGHA